MKFCVKGFVIGIAAATACTAVFTVFAAGEIKSAVFNDNRVVFDGKDLDLSDTPLISVVNEGEAHTTNYMPVRGVLEALGYEVEWDAESNSIIVTSKSGTDGEAAPYISEISNPWEACTEDEAFEYLGAGFKIEPPAGYTLSEAAMLTEPYAEEAGNSARFAYTNADNEMYRVHIHEGAAKELINQGEPVKTDEIDAYYDKDQSSVAYGQDNYMIVIDMPDKSRDELLETVGSVTLIAD